MPTVEGLSFTVSYSLIFSEVGRWRSHKDGHTATLGEGEGTGCDVSHFTAVAQLTPADGHSMAVTSDFIAQSCRVEPLASICHARHLLP